MPSSALPFELPFPQRQKLQVTTTARAISIDPRTERPSCRWLDSPPESGARHDTPASNSQGGSPTSPDIFNSVSSVSARLTKTVHFQSFTVRWSDTKSRPLAPTQSHDLAANRHLSRSHAGQRAIQSLANRGKRSAAIGRMDADRPFSRPNRSPSGCSSSRVARTEVEEGLAAVRDLSPCSSRRGVINH